VAVEQARARPRRDPQHARRARRVIYGGGEFVGLENFEEVCVRIAREVGIEDLWTWGFEACGHMRALLGPVAAAR
jgi:hypothetical protein